MVVIAILECHFKPEQVDAGIDWLRRNLVATRAFDGCLGVEVFKDRDDPSRVVAVEHSLTICCSPGADRCRPVREPSQADGWCGTRRRVGVGGVTLW